MMGDVKSIIEEYQKSDFEKRLYLFLGHRSLRKEFTDIDQNYPSLTQRERWFDFSSYLDNLGQCFCEKSEI